MRKAILVHGCFWHGHDCGRGARIPAQNRAYWKKKLTGNAVRDKEAQLALTQLGWDVTVFWECELKDAKYTKARVARFLRGEARRGA